mmetsp:Transcript_135381/g.432898  ORF Transcript_135381/g.432898 Transcript_135381/m.432898 type:complete len:528 (+) Transcript_135381:151-1734(+)
MAQRAWAVAKGPIKYSKHDPHGQQAMVDMSLPQCALQVAVGDSEDHAKFLKSMDEYYKQVRQLLEAKPTDSQEDNIRRYQTTKEVQSKLSNMPKEQKETYGRFFQLAGVVDLLSKDPYIRRWNATMRMLDGWNEHSESLDKYQTRRIIKLWYLSFPCGIFAFCFFIQSVMLHLATHFYIYYMELEEKAGGGKHQHARLFDLVGNWIAWLVGGERKKTGDAIIDGNVQIPIKLLDASGLIPVFLFCSVYAFAVFRDKFSIGLWNKTFIVASCMALLKGTFDLVTIMPDSMGWENCKARISESERETFHSLKFTQDGNTAFFKLMAMEILGGQHGRVRYCADMMISGHTYFACLFALSAYKQTFLAFGGVKYGKWVTRLVGLLCALSIATEMSLVAAARFHYTVDMLAAVVLVILLFDSTRVEQISVDWSEGFKWRDPSFVPKSSFQSFTKWLRQCCGKIEEKDIPDPDIIASRCEHLGNLRVLHDNPPWGLHMALFGDVESGLDLGAESSNRKVQDPSSTLPLLGPSP